MIFDVQEGSFSSLDPLVTLLHFMAKYRVREALMLVFSRSSLHRVQTKIHEIHFSSRTLVDT